MSLYTSINTGSYTTTDFTHPDCIQFVKGRRSPISFSNRSRVCRDWHLVHSTVLDSRHSAARADNTLGSSFSNKKASMVELAWRSITSITSTKSKVSLDQTRPCLSNNKNTKIHVRIHSTFNVVRACLFRMLSVLEVAQRVPPDHKDFTYLI